MITKRLQWKLMGMPMTRAWGRVLPRLMPLRIVCLSTTGVSFCHTRERLKGSLRSRRYYGRVASTRTARV